MASPRRGAPRPRRGRVPPLLTRLKDGETAEAPPLPTRLKDGNIVAPTARRAGRKNWMPGGGGGKRSHVQRRHQEQRCRGQSQRKRHTTNLTTAVRKVPSLLAVLQCARMAGPSQGERQPRGMNHGASHPTCQRDMEETRARNRDRGFASGCPGLRPEHPPIA